jgi:lipoprotein-anchoring transpeptidase ErfK/SrfK
VSEVKSKRRGRPGVAVALVGILIGGAVAVVLIASPSHPSRAEPGLPPPPRAVLAPHNVPLGPDPVAYWAPVLTSAAVRRAPGQAAVIANVGNQTPEGTANIVLVYGDAQQRAGKLWVRVRVPSHPDDAQGWVPRSVLGGYRPVGTRLVVDRRRLRAMLWRGDRRIFRARVGVGTASTPTPSGDFYVRNELHKYSSPFYGPVAFGTSARSATLTDWPAGGFVGIHGTNRPDLIPGRISHGCIRMTNTDILRLARLMPVGTPLTIR